jgi:hypothetical protein
MIAPPADQAGNDRRGEPYDPETGELLLATDAVEVVVKATEARAGEVAAATENSIAEPAPSTAETRAGSSFSDLRVKQWCRNSSELVSEQHFSGVLDAEQKKIGH